MLRAIDIASWQEGIVPSRTDADIVIVKATGGTWYVNPFFEQWCDDVLASGKLLGIYHYAVESEDDPNARAEADFYLDHVRRYKGKFVPVLDWEADAMYLPQEWAVEWMERVGRELGATPMFYAYASHLAEGDYDKVAARWPLWMASYLNRYIGSGWVNDPVNVWGYGSWDSMLMYQYTSTGHIQGYGGELDLSVFYGNRNDWERMIGGSVGKIDLANEAAEIHYFMVTDPRFGYNQQPTRWGESGGEVVTFTSSTGRKYRINAGDYDCSSSTITAWRLALQGTPYEGSLDGATYTGDMREVFVNSGLFWAEYSPAHRGDLYLAEGKHVAMCQDGGSDGVFGYDALSEFNRNENHAASWGESGDQDGYESVIREYYDDGWNTVLHYNHKADPEPAPERHIVPDGGRGAIYRMYNPWTGWHMWTIGRDEAQSLSDAGWTDEGVAWYAPFAGKKVRRLYNPHNGLHHFTDGDTEAMELIDAGWHYEGPSWLSGGSKDVYRLYNPHTGEHFFTTSADERDNLTHNGWIAEGVGMHAEK